MDSAPHGTGVDIRAAKPYLPYKHRVSTIRDIKDRHHKLPVITRKITVITICAFIIVTAITNIIIIIHIPLYDIIKA